MALPTGPIPLVAYDDIIEESWGDAVAQSLNNLKERHGWGEWQPSVEDLSGTAGSMTMWFEFGGSGAVDVDIPDWANSASVRFEINGVRDTDSTRSTFLLQLHIGTLTGRIIKHTGQAGWFDIGWSDNFPGVDTIVGDRKLSLYVQKISGAGQWAIDGDSDIVFDIEFGGAIG